MAHLDSLDHERVEILWSVWLQAKGSGDSILQIVRFSWRRRWQIRESGIYRGSRRLDAADSADRFPIGKSAMDLRKI